MKIVLQHKQTKRFLIDTKIWTEDPQEARKFATAVNACFFSVHNGLTEVDIMEIAPDMDPESPYLVQICA